MENSKSFLNRRIQSFAYAINGLVCLIREEPNARIHLIAALVAVIAGLWFQLSAMEWLFVILAIVLVFAFELINSALERLGDAVTKEQHALIKKSKDLSAAAVLACAVFAMVVALVVFLPRIWILV